MGPDNFGGRTRAIIFDNNDSESKTIYAAAVSGGIWKSVNGGITWKKVNKNNSNLYVSCMLQAPNGDIYVGTGESFAAQSVSGLGQMGYSDGFMGQGVFKSTDGENFSLLDATKPTLNDEEAEWAFVNELAIDMGTNRLYAATNTGLKFSNNNGESWSLAKDTAGTELTGNSFDVQVGSDGTVIAAVDNLCYISKGATNAFMLRSTGDSISLPNTNIGRLEFAIAPSDPNVMYASLAGINGFMIGVYKTDDKGTTWREIMPSTPSLEIFDGQGVYNNAITVFPNNPDRILVGGIDLWEGKQYDENGLFFWKTVSENLSGPLSPNYLHADHHTYVFFPGSDNRFLVGTDGGVAEGTFAQGEFTFKANNRNYFTAQFYTVGPSGLKKYALGGAQDNGTISITGKGNTVEQGNQILGGDGGSCAVSLIWPDVIVATSTEGTIRRSEDGGINYSTNAQFLDDGKIGNAQAFKTPIALWESFDNENSPWTVWFYPRDTIPGNSTIKVRSWNSGQPFWYTTPADVTLYPGDSILVPDPVSSVLFVPVAGTIWMTWGLHGFNQVPDWFAISNGDVGFSGTPQCMAYSSDANHIFVGTKEGRLFRISNLAYAATYELADVNSPACIVSTQEIPLLVPGTEEPISQVITSIAVDPENNNNVLVTLGNYGNEHYVLYSNNALAQTPDFESRQGDLPQMPVYASIIEMKDSNTGIIGTEYGVYTTKNLLDSSPQWERSDNNMGSVPVFELKQQTVSKEYMQVRLVNGPEVIIIDYPGTNNYGTIYAATYGRGLFWADDYFLVGTDENKEDDQLTTNEILVYPNPVFSSATVELEMNSNARVDVFVYDISGRQLMKQTRQLAKGKNKMTLDLSHLQPGVYLLRTVSGTDIRTNKIIVK
ncbi:MAG: T9SS type A sorting domain-containing protein [Bacteroidales bacterium]|nr:T9SS type A sorting domain-containing protein [Bacteroidales bacterium]